MNQRNSHKIAFVGCGRVAQHYLQLMTGTNQIDGLECVGACDLIQEKADAFTSKLGGKSFTDYEQMLSDIKPDLVFVLTPSGDHLDHAEQALKMGIGVVSEKPIGLDPDRARAIARFARDQGLMYGGVFQNRWNPAVRKVKSAMEDGRFGRIVSAAIRLRWCRTQDYYEDGWHGTWAQDGGVVNQQAIHHVDALNWICGPIEAVCAAGAQRANRLEAEDTLVAALKFANGSLGTIEVTTAARPHDFEASLSVVGELGLAQIGGIALNKIDTWFFVNEEAADQTVAANYSEEVPTGYGLGHIPMLRDIVGCLDEGKNEPPISAEDAVAAVDIVHALYSSIEQNSWVSLADKPRAQKLGRKLEEMKNGR